MISDQLLRIIRCPISGSSLVLASRELLEQLNAAIQAGRLTNRLGEPVPTALDGALVNQERSLAMPIIDGIPSLIADEAIPLDQLTHSAQPGGAPNA